MDPDISIWRKTGHFYFALTLLELRRIENNRALIDKWNGALPTVQSAQGSGMILQLPKPE